MPKADPAKWREARIRWECDPDLSLGEVARALNVALPTVSLRAKRELWVKSEIIEPTRLNYTPKELVEIAVRALVRAASQTYDIASSVKAAGMLLDRTMGRVMAEQTTPMLPPEETPQPEALPAPAWLEQSRHSYQAGPREDEPTAEEALAELDPAPPPSQPRIAAPARTGDPARPILHAVPAPEPKFWASPTTPAS